MPNRLVDTSEELAARREEMDVLHDPTADFVTEPAVENPNNRRVGERRARDAEMSQHGETPTRTSGKENAKKIKQAQKEMAATGGESDTSKAATSTPAPAAAGWKAQG